jgi:hypothetical protein
VIVNNSTKINKTNNHLSPQIIEKTATYEAGNLILAWDMHTNVAGLSQLMVLNNFI